MEMETATKTPVKEQMEVGIENNNIEPCENPYAKFTIENYEELLAFEGENKNYEGFVAVAYWVEPQECSYVKIVRGNVFYSYDEKWWLTEMWKMRRNRLFQGGVDIFIFAFGIVVGSLWSRFAENRIFSKGDVDKQVFISQEVQSSLEQLETFADITITRYCDDKSIENLYTFELFEDILHYNTRIYDVEERYTYDFNKTICPDLTNNRFLIKVEGDYNTIYVEVNTYRMKLYVYEEEKIGRIVKGEFADPMLDGTKLEECVECDWPEDMWELEYSSFVLEGWERLKTPDYDVMLRSNPELYGMVMYSLQRYCSERGIQEMFYFEFPQDKVSNVNVRIFTVKVTSDNRILYMDIDMDRNKVHIYQVE